MTKLPDHVVHAAVEGYFGYKMPPSEERNQTMRRALDAASLNIVAHVERLEENLAILRDENEKLRKALADILNDVGYRNPMRMTTEISDKILEDAVGALHDYI